MKSVPIAIPAVALLAVLLVLSAPPAHAQKPAPGAAAPASMAPAAMASPSGTGALRTFVSDRAAIPAEWAHAFVPFAFQYPSDWKIDPTATASGFFINVSRPVPGYPDGEASEIFAAFPFLAAESALESERASVAARWAEWMKQAWGFPSYSARPITVAGTTLPAFAFDGASDADETIWARLVIVPIDRVDGQVRGVGLIMVGSSLASEIRGIDDVGVRGGMATILASLRGGSAPGAAPSPQPAAYAGGQPAPQAYPAQPAPQAPATALRGSSASSGATSSTRSTGSSGGGLAALLGALTGAGSGGQGSANVSISAVMALLGGLGDAQTQSKLELIAQQLQGGAAEADIRVHLDSVLRSLGGGQGGGNLASLVEPILALLRGGSPAPAAMAAPMSGAPASAPAAGLKPGTAN